MCRSGSAAPARRRSAAGYIVLPARREDSPSSCPGCKRRSAETSPASAVRRPAAHEREETLECKAQAGREFACDKANRCPEVQVEVGFFLTNRISGRACERTVTTH